LSRTGGVGGSGGGGNGVVTRENSRIEDSQPLCPEKTGKKLPESILARKHPGGGGFPASLV